MLDLSRDRAFEEAIRQSTLSELEALNRVLTSEQKKPGSGVEDTDFYDRDDDDKDQGVGHEAWKWITHRLRAPDTDRLLDACSDRDEDGTEPMKRYCTEEEWSKRVDRYLKLNDACGKSKAKEGDLVVRLQRLLPVELRRNSALR